MELDVALAVGHDLDHAGLCQRMRQLGLRVETGRFRAMMDVRCAVDGPVTILVDSEKQF